MSLTELERDTLQHTLTGSSGMAPYRNYYAAGRGHHREAVLYGLVRKGLMEIGKRFGVDGRYYHCTQAGAAAVDLTLPADPGWNGPTSSPCGRKIGRLW